MTVQKGRASTSFRLTREQNERHWPVTSMCRPAARPCSLTSCSDRATGSMEDEIDELKENILHVGADQALPAAPACALGWSLPRPGRCVRTRVSDFTGDVNAFQRALMRSPRAAAAMRLSR